MRIDFNIGGMFELACYDSHSNLKWRDTMKNGVTQVGLEDLLDVYFRQGTPLAGFAVGLISGPGPNLAATDTHSSHDGWSEFTKYRIDGDNQIRPVWVSGPPAATTVANTIVLNYAIASAGRVAGAFMAGGVVGATSPSPADADLKGSTDPTPLLWATALLTKGEQTVVGNDQLKLTYRIRASST